MTNCVTIGPYGPRTMRTSMDGRSRLTSVFEPIGRSRSLLHTEGVASSDVTPKVLINSVDWLDVSVTADYARLDLWAVPPIGGDQ